MEDYIKRLKQIRKEKDMTFEQCAKELGIHGQMLVMFENGEMIPTDKQMETIVEYVLSHI